MKTLSQMERGLSNRLAYRRTELRGRDIARYDVGTRQMKPAAHQFCLHIVCRCVPQEQILQSQSSRTDSVSLCNKES